MAVERPHVEIAGTGKKVQIGATRTPVLIGERINPTNRKVLAEKIRRGDWAFVQREAVRQVEAGAQALDVNVGVPSIDERAAMVAAVRAIQDVVDVPLVIDNSNPEVLREALRSTQGRPLINSTSAESKRLKSVVPLAREFGVPLVGLCLEDAGIPASARRRVELARLILDAALAAGLESRDLVIDCLVLPAGAAEGGAAASLDAVRAVTEELGLNTTCGLSNVSFGLPDRPKLNARLLCLFSAAGLSSFIGDPHDAEVQHALHSIRLLWGEDRMGMGYLKHIRGLKRGSDAPVRS